MSCVVPPATETSPLAATVTAPLTAVAALVTPMLVAPPIRLLVTLTAPAAVSTVTVPAVAWVTVTSLPPVMVEAATEPNSVTLVVAAAVTVVAPPEETNSSVRPVQVDTSAVTEVLDARVAVSMSITFAPAGIVSAATAATDSMSSPLPPLRESSAVSVSTPAAGVATN